MSKICYIEKTFRADSLAVIEQANTIIGEYQSQNLDMSLRQLYYQFVARGLIENTQKSYKRLGSIINDARMAGMVDWWAMEDRTRNLMGTIHQTSPAKAIKDIVEGYAIDKWGDQEYRIEAWCEKEALIGVFAGICNDLDLDYFACRGFVSQSEMWRAAMRMRGYERNGQKPVVLHFGDHDPSGIDMTRDIKDRFKTFGASVEVRRIALNMDQVEEHNPPPNPAKTSDSRFSSYVAAYGEESWELDALDPILLRNLVQDRVFEYRDVDLWDAAVREEEDQRRQLEEVSNRWEEILGTL